VVERGILFSAPMVRALLDGTKTQTRRVMKPQPVDGKVHQLRGRFDFFLDVASPEALALCPYGVPGDRLWVRETCQGFEQPDGLDGVRYLADGAFRSIENTEAAADAWIKLANYAGKKCPTVPAIHMPRWASRITLELVNVRVERLQDISEKDAIAEGVSAHRYCRQDDDAVAFHRIGPVRGNSFPIARYAALWESINGPGSWALNPWVWVVSFRRL
jgi:hypothetical protein